MKQKLVRNLTGLMLLFLLSLTALPITGISNRSGLPAISPGHHTISEGAALITDIPYVWQEINGFCYWGACTMALQAAGVPTDLHSFFAASGIGFSYAYIRVNDTMSILSGSLFFQVGQLVPICDLYGLEQAVYLDNDSYWGNLAIQTWSQWNPNLKAINGEAEAFEILKSTLDDGFPVVLWTDPYYLPVEDYQILRDYGFVQNATLPDSGHAILAVGYNDTSNTVEIMDPGVGSFGEDFGYPHDGRWSYSINYTLLNSAWSSLAYGMTTIKPANGTIPDFETKLGKLIVSRLLGNPSSYVPFTDEGTFYLNCGEKAFRGLSYDMNPSGLKNYLDEFEGLEERLTNLVTVGLTIEMMLTLQYLSYRTAIDSLPTLMPETDIARFQSAAEDALSHMEILSDNRTLVSLNYMETHDSLISNTFLDMAQDYQSSHDMDSVLNDYTDELSEIANHLLAIADSWKAAGLALESALSNNEMLTAGLVVGIMIGGILVVVVTIVRRRTGA